MKTIKEIQGEQNVPAVLADGHGVISWVNTAFQQAFGWSTEEAIGQPLTLLIPKYMQDAHHLGFSRFLSTGTAHILNKPLQLRTVDKGGSEFNAEHVIVAENLDGEWTFGATIRPLPEG